MTEKWCEHISKESLGFYFTNPAPGWSHSVSDVWKACPVCMVPRPAPKKTMGKLLMDEYVKPVHDTNYEMWDRIASRAKELILDGKEAALVKMLGNLLYEKYSDEEIIKRILTYLRESC